LKITAHCVYENDLFDYELGDNEFIKHKPALSNRGKQVGAYAIFKLKNGETVRGFMDIAGIEKRRLSSKSAEGNYWKKWYDEMSRKTVIKWAAKEIDKSIDYNDDEDTDNIIPPQISYKPEESNKPQLVEPEQVQEAEVVDRDTGEITTLTEKTPKKVSVQTNSSDEPF
jgi:recombination protein RecT